MDRQRSVHMKKPHNKKQFTALLSFITIGLVVACTCWTFYKSVSSSDESEAQHPQTTTRKQKLLVAQYTAGASSRYDDLLRLTSFINKAYADRWGYDYYVRHGFPFGLDQYISRTNASVPESMATYNKVHILLNTLVDEEYDMLLLLDADAMIYDFDHDIISLLPPDKVVAAHKVVHNDTVSTWNLNIGVTLWGLRNVRTTSVAEQWKARCLDRIEAGRRDSDQMPFYKVLKNLSGEERSQIVVPLLSEFKYGEGTVVKHFIRVNNSRWQDNVAMKERLAHVQNCANEVCARYDLNCSEVLRTSHLG